MNIYIKSIPFQVLSNIFEFPLQIFSMPKENFHIPNRTNHLISIGIDKYQFQKRLNNASADATKFKEVLVKNYQFDPSNVTTLLNEQATRTGILKCIRECGERLTDHDNLIIYYAGHGEMSRKKTTGFWIPVEAKENEGYIPNDRIRTLIKEMDAHHIYLIIDACFGGAMITRDLDSTTSINHTDGNQPRSRRVFTSGREERVLDGPLGGHSPFLKSIITKLEDAQNPISTNSLEHYVIEFGKHNFNQKPQAAIIFGTGHDLGQFTFYPKNYIWHKSEEKRKVLSLVPANTRKSFAPQKERSNRSRINLQNLENFLIKGDYKKADIETTVLLLQICGKRSDEWITEHDIKSVPQNVLDKINATWSKYSEDRLSFGAQRAIWRDIEARLTGDFKPNDTETFMKFAQQIGWTYTIQNFELRSHYDELNFTKYAPDGHLPSLRNPNENDLGGGWKEIWQQSVTQLIHS